MRGSVPREAFGSAGFELTLILHFPSTSGLKSTDGLSNVRRVTRIPAPPWNLHRLPGAQAPKRLAGQGIFKAFIGLGRDGQRAVKD
jgi:hypothetical protein